MHSFDLNGGGSTFCSCPEPPAMFTLPLLYPVLSIAQQSCCLDTLRSFDISSPGECSRVTAEKRIAQLIYSWCVIIKRVGNTFNTNAADNTGHSKGNVMLFLWTLQDVSATLYIFKRRDVVKSNIWERMRVLSDYFLSLKVSKTRFWPIFNIEMVAVFNWINATCSKRLGAELLIEFI